MKRKIITHPFIPLPDDARDAYELAQERNITPAEAAAAMRREGWEFIGYNDDGQEAFLPPRKR